jgi:hypothetical protein
LVDTDSEVTIMPDATNSTDADGRTPTERFRQLPERVKLEDTTTTQPSAAPADPATGRNTEQDDALRAGG